VSYINRSPNTERSLILEINILGHGVALFSILSANVFLMSITDIEYSFFSLGERRVLYLSQWRLFEKLMDKLPTL
jgi:hypothetical protein